MSENTNEREAFLSAVGSYANSLGIKTTDSYKLLAFIEAHKKNESVATLQSVAEADEYLSRMISESPEPIIALGKILANKLDEDDFNLIEPYLIKAAKLNTLSSGDAFEKAARVCDSKSAKWAEIPHGSIIITEFNLASKEIRALIKETP